MSGLRIHPSYVSGLVPRFAIVSPLPSVLPNWPSVSSV